MIALKKKNFNQNKKIWRQRKNVPSYFKSVFIGTFKKKKLMSRALYFVWNIKWINILLLSNIESENVKP
jgi:hypothetical protein